MTMSTFIFMAFVLVNVLLAYHAGAAANVQTNIFYEWSSIKEDLFLTWNEVRYPGLAYCGPVVVTEHELKAIRDSPECQPAEKDPKGNWGPKVAGFQLSLRFPSAEVANAQDIVAVVLLRNVTNCDLEFPLFREGPRGVKGFFIDNFEFDMIGPHGERIAGKQRGFNPLSKRWQVREKTQRKLEIRLNDEFDFSEPGRYRVRAKTFVREQNSLNLIPIYSGEAVFEIRNRRDARE